MPEPSQRLMKIAIDSIARHDLALHLGHELEVVRAERAGDPHLGRGPVPARLAVGVDGDPVGMRALRVVVGGVRIGARDDDHAELAAAGDQIAKRIAVTEPLAAMMERDRGRIVGDAAARAEADGVGFRALEVIEPELRIELARIVLDERELRPAHRAIDPRRPAGPGVRTSASPRVHRAARRRSPRPRRRARSTSGNHDAWVRGAWGKTTAGRGVGEGSGLTVRRFYGRRPASGSSCVPRPAVETANRQTVERRAAGAPKAGRATVQPGGHFGAPRRRCASSQVMELQQVGF